MREPEFPAKLILEGKQVCFGGKKRSFDKMALMYTCVEEYINFDVP